MAQVVNSDGWMLYSCAPDRRVSSGIIKRWHTEEGLVEGKDFPNCLSCTGGGSLLPLSDFGSQGAPIHYKAWVCSNPDCGYNIKIRNGDVYLNEPIANGATHSPRFR